MFIDVGEVCHPALIDNLKARGWDMARAIYCRHFFKAQRDNDTERQTVRSFADDFECTPMLPPGRLKIRKAKIVAKPNVVVGANVFVSRPNHGENFRMLLIFISYNTYN